MLRFVMQTVRFVFGPVLAVPLLIYWGLMLAFGQGDFFSGMRSFRVGPIYVSSYILILYSVLFAPTAFLCACRWWQMRKPERDRFARWTSLGAMTKTFTLLTILVLALLLYADTPWSRMAHTDWIQAVRTLVTGSDTYKPPSDEKLKYPSLPLAPPDPYAWTLKDLDGNDVPLAQFRGKTLFINTWATWCYYCKAEFPNIERLIDAMKDRNVVFLLVSPEEPEVVKKWIAETKCKLPIYITPDGFPPTYEPGGFPTTFIVAPDGRMAFKHDGCAAWDGEKTKSFLAELAKQPASPEPTMPPPAAATLNLPPATTPATAPLAANPAGTP
jgi:thiol-disulfide isomerase/thioredoxin